MPVLGQHHVIDAFGEPIDNRHHRIAIGTRMCPPGQKSFLHIDNQQQIIVAWSDLHSGPVFVSIATLWRYTGVCESVPLCKAQHLPIFRLPVRAARIYWP